LAEFAGRRGMDRRCRLRIHRGGEIFFAGAVVNYTADVQIFTNFAAKFAEAFGGPAYLERQPPPGLNTT